MYIGGAVDEADRMVATGKAKRDDFKFMLHLCGWAPGQLEAEIERGVWLSVATSTNVSQYRVDYSTRTETTVSDGPRFDHDHNPNELGDALHNWQLAHQHVTKTSTIAL